MGRIEKDTFGDGYTVYNDDGSTEHFTKNTFGDGYTGNKGTHADPHVFGDGFTITRKDSSSEAFDKNITNGNYTGKKGTKIRRDVFGSGASVSGGHYGYSGNAGGTNSPSDIGSIGLVLGIGAVAMLLPFMVVGWAAILPSFSILAAFLIIWLFNKRVPLTLLFLWSQPFIRLGWFRLSILLLETNVRTGDLDIGFGMIGGYLGIAMLAVILLGASVSLCDCEWGMIYLFPDAFLWINSLGAFDHSYGYWCIVIMFLIAAIPSFIFITKSKSRK